MPIVNAYGKRINFPDDMSHEEIANVISANEKDLNPDYTSPNPEALDYAKGFAAGANKLVSGVGYLAEAAGAKETGKAIREFGDRGAAYWNSKLSPGGKKAAESQVFVDDPESITGLRLGDDAVKALLMGASQSLPSMFAAALPGVAITKGIQALASLGLAGGSGATIPLLAGTAAPVGTAANVIARVPSAFGFGMAEGLVSAGMNAADFKSSIEGMSDKELSKSPVYLALKAEHGEGRAKQLIADQAASDIFGRTALSTGTIGAITGGGALGQAYQKATTGAADGIVKSFLKGAGQEAIQETPQSAGEKYIENLATKDYINPDVDTSSGVLSSAASGGAVGAFTGGIFGAGSAVNITTSAQQKADRINAERAKLGLEKIVKAATIDQAITAANESVSQKPVDKEDVLRVADPTLADIERLTGLKPSESIQETEKQQSILSQAQQENNAIQSDIEGQNNRKPKTPRDTEIVLPDNKTLNAQWDIVDADNVKASLKNGESQPRDRTRAASDLQIQSIAKNPDYRRLSDSPVMDIGAPVLSNDGQIVGGNGRFEAISRAYDQDTAQEYIDNLRQDAIRKGIDPAVIDQMKKPVLVRRITQPFDTRQLAIASNSGMSAQYSDLEQAKIDSERLKGLEDILTTDNGDIALTADNIRRVRDSLGNYSPAEIAPFVDANGQLSQQGIKRIRNAMLAKAYGDNPVIQGLIESNDSDVRNILGALTRVVGDVIKAKANAPKESDITPSILEAVNIYSQLRQQNKPVSSYLQQQDAFSERAKPAVENILMFLGKNARSQPKLTEFFRDAYTKLGSIDTKTSDIFGQEVKPKPEDLFAKPTIENELEKHLKKNGYEFDVKPVTEREFNALPEPKKAQKELAEKQAKIFGKKVVFVKTKGDFGINGVMVPAIKDTIFIDLDTPKPFHAVMAHELSHWMEQESPKAYKDMLGALKNIIINEEGYRKKYGITDKTKGLIPREIAGDLMGDNFTKPEFWQKVAEYNPSKFKEIAQNIIKWLKNIILKAKSRGMGSEEWVTDAKKAQDIIAKAVSQYTKQQDAVGEKVEFKKHIDELKLSKQKQDNKDKEYLQAVKRGDIEKAQKMVDDAARDKGYISGTEYRMMHQAPNREDYNLATIKESGIVPDDYWTHPQYYQSDATERESFNKVNSAIDRQRRTGRKAGITVYRAVPKNIKDTNIRNGDWVTPSREYARMEGEGIPGGYRIISAIPNIDNLWWDANSINELGYDDGKEYAYKNTKNNRKLIDAVTYDDDGNVIPLSKRFNSRSDDVRFSKQEETNKEELPETITIDGIERPTRNSEGRLIHSTERGIRKFWKWFGNSVVVDDQGRPLVVYHGSKSDIKKFKTDVLGSSTGASSATKGFFFTDSIENSERYAYYIASASSEYKEKAIILRREAQDIENLVNNDLEKSYNDYSKYEQEHKKHEENRKKIRRLRKEASELMDKHNDMFIESDYETSKSSKTGANIIPVYLKLTNPLTYDYRNKSRDVSFADLIDDAILSSNDGAIFRNVKDPLPGNVFVVFNPNQIKSAIGNTGEFSESNNDIRFSKTELDEFGEFKTGVPVTFNYLHNKESATELLGIPKDTNNKEVQLNKGEKLWLRYGDIPDSQKSKHVQHGFEENGVSVVAPLDDLGNTSWSMQMIFSMTAGEMAKRDLYVVAGKQLKHNPHVYGESGYGSDGEPLIENARVIRKATQQERYLLVKDMENVATREFGMSKIPNLYKLLKSEKPDSLDINDNIKKKSAIGNNGEFSGSNNDIRFSQQKPFNPNEDIPETKFQKTQRVGQDKFNRFRVIKEWLAKEKGINLSEAADVYGAEERYYGKVANQQEDFREKIRNPLIEKISKAGYKLDDVEQYLLNRHAQEANVQNRKLTGKSDSTAYGIPDEDAEAYLDKAPRELAKLADEVQALTDKAQQLRLDNGIETDERVNAMKGAYQYYVPVRGDAESQQKQNQYKGTGKGFSMKYKPRRRLGHELRNESVIENIFQDYERAIMQVEKNRIGKSLALMAAEIQMPELISIDQPVKRKVLQNQKAYGVLVKGELQDVFQTEEAAKQNRQLLVATDKKLTLSDITIAPIKDQRLIYSASPMLADNEVMVYMNGHEIRLQINDELLARAYKNMGTEALGNILSTGRSINGWMSKAYTGYNPEFILTNIQRDFQSGIINLTGEQGISIAAKAVANYPKSFASLLKYAANGESDKWIDAYRDNGGNTGAAYLPDLERLGEEVKREYASYQGVIANLKEGDSANALRAAGRKAFNATLKYINHLNAAGENAFRLATFKAMVESGKSVNEAASMAKNVTVNFNRKGEMGAELDALYLFFNASLQGTAATSHALFKGRHKFQAWGLSGAMMSVGYMMASMLGGFDDEDKYDEISDATKSRNLIMSYGDGYVKIPVPYGYGFFYNAGRMLAEAQRKGEIGKMPYQLMALATEEFSPFNVASTEDSEFSSKKVYYGFLPTMLKIPAEITNNYSSFANRELYPEKTWYQSEPDNEKMWRETKGTVYDISAQYLASIGIEISPEVLKYMTRTATGGSGAFVDSAVSGAILKSQGAELEAREIPFARKFYGENTIQDARARYGKAKEEARIAFEKFNALRKKNDIESVRNFVNDKKELLALNSYANKLSEVIKNIRDQQDLIKLSDKYTTAEKRLKIKELENQEKKYYDMFMKQYKTVKH